tara:strand:- start:143 stop:1042 length:900 start_codon:yes stop_codon:yes gene_type:complete
MSGNGPYVIAEAGACGDATLSKMIEQVDECSGFGVDAVKFQWTSSGITMAARRGQAVLDGYDEVYEKYLEWPSEWHSVLSERCRVKGCDYLCTVYLPEDVEVIAPHVAHYKVASFEALDPELQSSCLNHVDNGQMLFVSLGMCSDEDVRLLEQVHRELILRSDVVLFHCVSAYPTPLEQLNLGVLNTYESIRGFSDHTRPTKVNTGALATMAGAHFIEAHHRLRSTEKTNPDAAHAMTGVQFNLYVQMIREAHQSLGVGLKRCEEIEQQMTPYRFLSDPMTVERWKEVTRCYAEQPSTT